MSAAKGVTWTDDDVIALANALRWDSGHVPPPLDRRLVDLADFLDGVDEHGRALIADIMNVLGRAYRREERCDGDASAAG